MRRKIRRMTGLVLAVILCFCMLSTTVFADAVFNIYDMTIEKGSTLILNHNVNLQSGGTLINYGTIEETVDVKMTGSGTFYNYGIYQISEIDGPFVYDLTLSSIVLSSSTLSPTFEAGTREYEVSVDNSVASIDITPTLNTGTGVKSMTVNGTRATSGIASTVSLNVGVNSIPIVITASDGSDTANTYTLTVTRASAATHTHSLIHVEMQEATCTVDGNSEYWYCGECGKYFSDLSATAEISQSDTVIAAKGHSLTRVDAKAATCTEAGNDRYWYCSVCGGYFSNSSGTETTTLNNVTIPATGHSYKAVVTEPTCTEKGYTTYTCSLCGDSYTADETEATGHTWDNGTVTTEATCTKDGVKTYTCTVCGETRTEKIEATGHSYEAVVTEPTCTEKGYTTYTCSACGDSYTADETDATGHSYGSWYSDKQNHWHTCAQCGEIADQEAHSFGAWTVTKEPTATATGLKTRTCTVCGYTQTRRIAATDSDNPKTGGPALSLLLPAAALGGLALLTGKRRGRGKFPKNQD